MITQYKTIPTARPVSDQPPAMHDRPLDPARVSPMHLPALAELAADLDGLAAPVHIVNRADLGACAACPDGDLPESDAIATVVSTDAHGFRYRDRVCALHLDPEVGYHSRAGHTVVVEVPAFSRRWFERTDRETYFALDECHGVAAVRDMHDCWAVVDTTHGIIDTTLALVPDRAVAELLAQAVAAVRAADAYELGYAAAEAAAKALFPAAAVTEVAA